MQNLQGLMFKWVRTYREIFKPALPLVYLLNTKWKDLQIQQKLVYKKFYVHEQLLR